MSVSPDHLLRQWCAVGPYLPTSASKNGLLDETRRFLQAYADTGSVAPDPCYIKAHYKPGKRDIYAAFILRCLALCLQDGRVAMVTQQSWMFLRSFAELRALPEERLADARRKRVFSGLLRETSIEGLAHLGPNAFEEISGEVVLATLFTLANTRPEAEHRIAAFRRIDDERRYEMEPSLTRIPETVQRDLEHATTILKAGGCRSVFLFGSAATGTMHAGSDLDLAVRGCPPQQFFHLLGRLLADLEHPVDLVDLDVPGPFVEFLLANGKLVQLG